MIVESVTVRRFRAIEEATLQLGGVTYLVGRNGAGKSTFLNALGAFFGVVAVAGTDDFHRHTADQPIEIAMTFGQLGSSAEAEFEKYVRDGRLIVTRRFEWNGARVVDSFHGVASIFPGFAAIRALSGRERIDAYRAQREQFELPVARSGVEVDRALAEWEVAHQDDLELAEDDGQFFGYRNVAAGKLDRYVDFVLVPAVREASVDAADGRDSALRRLVDAVVRRSVDLEAPLSSLRQSVADGYATLLGRPELALDGLEDRMTRSIQRFAPGAEVVLAWSPMAEVRLQEPTAIARLVDDGFEGDVATKGHGLQRAYLMAALQALAELEVSRQGADTDGDAAPSRRSLLLAVEEPELYQHPAQARFIARTFDRLAGDSAGQVRILACTHSPIFVEVRSFDGLRLVRKDPATDGPITTVTDASLDEVAALLATVHEPDRHFTGAGLRPGLVALMNPYVNEALFADYVILVEGEEDKALVEAYLARQVGWPEVATRAIAVVPVGGKKNLDKLSAILSCLEVPHFLVFDRDGERREPHEQVERWNSLLQRLSGVEAPEPMPPTGIGARHAVFAPTVTAVVSEEMGTVAWRSLQTDVCQGLGIESRDGGVKNAETLRIMLDRASALGMSSPSLDAAATAIIAAIARDLRVTVRQVSTDGTA